MRAGDKVEGEQGQEHRRWLQNILPWRRWKKKTRDRGGWKILSDEAVKSCGQHLTELQREKRKHMCRHHFHDYYHAHFSRY